MCGCLLLAVFLRYKEVVGGNHGRDRDCRTDRKPLRIQLNACFILFVLHTLTLSHRFLSTMCVIDPANVNFINK